MSKSLETTKDIDAVDEYGLTALHHAVEKGDLEEVERLLAAGANVDARTADLCTTPLIIATTYQHFDVMRLLLNRGADIDACDATGSENGLIQFRTNNERTSQVDGGA